MIKYLMLLFLFMGCSSGVTCRIESDTFWAGNFGGTHYSGDGDKIISINDASDCITAQKQTQGGMLRITVTEKTTFHGTEDIGQDQTIAPYGVVSVCNE